MNSREHLDEISERIRHLPRSERKAILAEQMTDQEEAELLRDSVVAFVGLVLLALAPFIF